MRLQSEQSRGYQSDLWNDGESRAKILESVSTDGNIVNCNVSGGGFDDTEESKCEGRLPSTSTTHNTNLREHTLAQVVIKTVPTKHRPIPPLLTDLSRQLSWLIFRGKGNNNIYSISQYNYRGWC